jgi:hypothetical protein
LDPQSPLDGIDSLAKVSPPLDVLGPHHIVAV